MVTSIFSFLLRPNITFNRTWLLITITSYPFTGVFVSWQFLANLKPECTDFESETQTQKHLLNRGDRVQHAIAYQHDTYIAMQNAYACEH